MIEAYIGPNLTVATTDIAHNIPRFLNETNINSIWEHLYRAGFSYERVVNLIKKLRESGTDPLNYAVDLYTSSQSNMLNRAYANLKGKEVWKYVLDHAFDLVIGNMPTRGRLLFEATAQTSPKIALINGEGSVKNNRWVFAEEIDQSNIFHMTEDSTRRGFVVADMQDLVADIEREEQYGAIVILACNPSNQKILAKRAPIFYCHGIVGKNDCKYSNVTAFPKA
jgi:hypothetical protein